MSVAACLTIRDNRDECRWNGTIRVRIGTPIAVAGRDRQALALEARAQVLALLQRRS